LIILIGKMVMDLDISRIYEVLEDAEMNAWHTVGLGPRREDVINYLLARVIVLLENKTNS
jgi:hypothetical protein